MLDTDLRGARGLVDIRAKNRLVGRLIASLCLGRLGDENHWRSETSRIAAGQAGPGLWFAYAILSGDMDLWPAYYDRCLEKFIKIGGYQDTLGVVSRSDQQWLLEHIRGRTCLKTG